MQNAWPEGRDGCKILACSINIYQQFDSNKSCHVFVLFCKHAGCWDNTKKVQNREQRSQVIWNLFVFSHPKCLVQTLGKDCYIAFKNNGGFATLQELTIHTNSNVVIALSFLNLHKSMGAFSITALWNLPRLECESFCCSSCNEGFDFESILLPRSFFWSMFFFIKETFT